MLMAHPRSTCQHASLGTRPAYLVCALKIVPDDSHVGACKCCPKHSAAPCTYASAEKELTPDAADLAKLIEQNHQDPLLGDRVEAWVKQMGADKAAAAWERWTGIPCGCTWRKNVLNKLDGVRRSWFGKRDA
jgi:hypothetical protein